MDETVVRNMSLELDKQREEIRDLRAKLADAQREIAVRDKALDLFDYCRRTSCDNCEEFLSGKCNDRIGDLAIDKTFFLKVAREAVKK